MIGGSAPPSLMEMAAGTGGGGNNTSWPNWQAWANETGAARMAGALAGSAPAAPGDGSVRGGDASSGHNYFGDISTQPGMSDYYDPTTHMPRMSDASTAAEQGGTSLAGLAGGFFPSYVTDKDQGYRIPSDQGGFFNIEDVYRRLGRDIPRIGTLGQNAPSTNNWRLLGMGPGWIMRNGQLIDALSSGAQQGGPAAWSSGGGLSAEHFVSGRGTTALGAGQGYGVPNMIQAGAGHPVGYGWPGATQWNSLGGTGMSATY